MNWMDFLLIGFFFGTSFGLILSVVIEKLIDCGFAKERKQMNLKIDKIT